MATLIFLNGNHKKVTYDQGAHVNDVLMGYKEPENEEQAKFCETVERVEFESPVKTEKKDDIMLAIFKDKNLTGHERCKAIVSRIKERQS